MSHAIRTTRRAEADLDEAVRWRVSHGGPAVAARWQSGILRAIRSLARDPGRYSQAEEAADLGVDLREMLHGRRGSVFRVLFTIDGDTVNVHRVRHAARDRLGPDDV